MHGGERRRWGRPVDGAMEMASCRGSRGDGGDHRTIGTVGEGHLIVRWESRDQLLGSGVLDNGLFLTYKPRQWSTKTMRRGAGPEQGYTARARDGHEGPTANRVVRAC